jgi:tetratricopeptide (TPR) repeat protein
MAERFLYLPLMGFLMALGGMFLNVSRVRAGLAAAAAALIVIWTGTSLSRMGIWRDELTLFLGTELEHPGIKRVEQNAVGAVLRLPLITAGRTARELSPEQAGPMIATLQRARQIYPENDALTTQLGIIEMKTGQLREAVALLELAVRQNPGSAERWYNLASIDRLAGQPHKAQEACAQALRLDPQDQEALHLQSELAQDLKSAPATEAPDGTGKPKR